ncbi:hypothetical protein [Pseudoalteromonas phenolica]|nr:hypothetical protein [Pseudoalteromonas phenolica]
MENSVKEEMLSCDLIISNRGRLRDAISFIGEDAFDSIPILEINNKLEENIEIKSSNDDTTKIGIDISLIDRKTLAGLFSTLAKVALKYQFEIRIIYTLAEYTPPSGESHPNNNVKPVSNFFSGWSSRPGLPILSIVGLGYERDKAIGAVEFLESSEAFLYLPKSNEQRYYSDVMKGNKRLIECYPDNHQFAYDLESPTQTILSLDAVINAYKNKFKIVLLPFGPKLFYALSLIISVHHPEISVWHVSGEQDDTDSTQDRSVSGLIGFSFCISNSEAV